MKARAASRRLVMGVGVVLPVVCLLLACLPPFPKELLRKPASVWRERDARAFLGNSFWSSVLRASFSGLRKEAEMEMTIQVSWVSPAFRERRLDLLRRFGSAWPRRAQLAGECSADRPLAFPVGSFEKAAPLTPWLFAALPAAAGPGLWPTEAVCARKAAYAVHLATAPGATLDADLTEEWGPADAFQVDFVFAPALTQAAQAAPVLKEAARACVAEALGHLAGRGLRLVRADGAERSARRVAVLGVGRAEGTTLFGPLFVRAWFAREDEKGGPWLGEFPARVHLEIDLPPGAEETCRPLLMTRRSLGLTARWTVELAEMRAAGWTDL